MTSPILLVGAGAMARAYAAVLKDLERPFTVIGRSAASAGAFHDAVGVQPETGGLESWLQRMASAPRQAIVAVNVDQLHPTTLQLIEAGVDEILVEKPAALTVAQLDALADAAQHSGSEVFVGYNRRFLASTLAARLLLREDGGARSFSFDFTEIAARVGSTDHPETVKQAWLLANSTHVIDLAFFLGGQPAQLATLQDGDLPWHRVGSRFAGSGVTASGALFSYLADWEAPGRWGVELRTALHRIELRPLEQLHVQRHGSFEIDRLELDDELDRRFKPGLYLQTRAFLDAGDPLRDTLPRIEPHRTFVRDVVRPIATHPGGPVTYA